jgi:light-harvesting protein B-800-850 alpha chain
VLTIALLVHFAVLSHTTWFGGYWQGGKGRAAAVAPASPPSEAQAAVAPQR